ncbi:PAS domain S-box protein [Mucilaginibacter sp. E4BP6]|uniref:PAS domain S-box protein n=1 Tax=Mucilaginibacter sp. E4BP6 TaxID=2723089 RepID=UPI0015CB8421|nr:PAS domain S-box protein [Mucilaginibacter sp. E4BP6]NYE64357.1 PAS domain S-box-containing protein [Mucilaginibacter sp. E4BP6]
MIKNWWLRYRQTVKGKTFSRITGSVKELSYWQDILFFNFLFYCLPISFIAVIPGVFMSVKYGYTSIAVVDIISLVLLCMVTFIHQIPLRLRKLFIIVIFYLLAVFLITVLGYNGPGVFYLFAITILTALVFPRNYGYWTILANALILSSYAVIIWLNLFHFPANQEYTTGKWIAFSSNLIFLSTVLVALINRIFKSLQDTISNQVETEKELSLTTLKIKQSETSLRTIFESSIDGFILLDEEFKIKAFNNKAKQYVLLNITEVDFEPGQEIFDYVAQANQEDFQSAITKAYQGETVEYDRRYHPDAETIQWIRYTITPVYEDQIIKGACITGRDVTIRKLYLQNLEDQNKTFREISWMQSHAVRAPLARIMGLIELLKTSRDNDFEKTIDCILLSAHELDEIINKISLESNSIISKYPLPADIHNGKTP